MRKGLTRREHEVTDINEIVGILDRAKVAHVGMIDDNKPYVVSMNYGYIMENENLTIYLHGATEGRKLDILKKNPNVFIEIDTDIEPFEGEKPCQYGISYSSIMCEGVAEIVDDVEEKKKALSILMKTQTGKDFEFDDRMTTIVSVIRINVDSFTAKKRPKPCALV
ncbi:MAG: pyridoxamine 5'-phosphate oxidase family protein [Agathobacter sp.]|nr:pyridoxamine 5'-phosphate oxidase family protein [Agathobacter sp.]